MNAMPRLPFPCLLLCICVFVALPASASESPEPLIGWLSIAWADSPPGEDPVRFRRLTLTTDEGTTVPLRMSNELLRGGVFRWNGRQVRVYPAADGAAVGEGAARWTSDGELRVAAIQLVDRTKVAGSGVTGSQPWVSLLCKFSDISAEPENLAYFQNMYGDAPGRLNHYWREVSDNQIDVVGSLAVDWVNLPGTQISYAPTPGSGFTADLSAVFDDCTAAADAFVDFSPFVGINIMVNDLLDCCAWGGSRYATLDGVTKSWRSTWNPPWSFANESVIAHEMGHGFGMPHANNFDGDDSPYDSPWDVMSSASGYSYYLAVPHMTRRCHPLTRAASPTRLAGSRIQRSQGNVTAPGSSRARSMTVRA